MNWSRWRHNKRDMSRAESRRRHYQAQIGPSAAARRRRADLLKAHAPEKSAYEKALDKVLSGFPTKEKTEIIRRMKEEKYE